MEYKTSKGEENSPSWKCQECQSSIFNELKILVHRKFSADKKPMSTIFSNCVAIAVFFLHYINFKVKWFPLQNGTKSLHPVLLCSRYAIFLVVYITKKYWGTLFIVYNNAAAKWCILTLGDVFGYERCTVNICLSSLNTIALKS